MRYCSDSGAVHELKGGTVLQDRDIVYFSCLDWEPSRARPQQIALELAAANRVLYVEPMISLASMIERLIWQHHTRSLIPRVRRIQNGLFLYTPPSFLPFSLRSESLNSINKSLLVRCIRSAMERLEFRRPIVAVSHPSHHEMVGQFDEEFSFYDCMDHYTLLPDRRANPVVLAAMERKLVNKADLVFVTSEALHRGQEPDGSKWVLVRNGVDLDHFDPDGCRLGEPDQELAGIPGPIIGYIGGIGSWFDGDAVAHLAASRPDLSLVLVGPVLDRATARKLRFSPNVYLLGQKPYQDLPRYLDAFAVCLIPFQVNELTRTVNPVKLYEYLATGKPVVAAELDEVTRYRDIVSLYATKEELVKQVERALREQDPEAARLRVRVAGENTWRRRVEEMGTALAGYLTRGAEAKVISSDAGFEHP